MCEKLLDGSLTAHKNYVSGFYKGYYITIDYKPPVFIVYIHATFDNLSGKAQFEGFLKEYQKATSYVSKAEAKDHTVKLRIVQPKPKKILISTLNDIIEPVISQLLACKYETGCINCGVNDVPIDCYVISGYHHYLCEQCVREIEENFQIAQRALLAKPSNTILGTIGALLGSLVGVVLWCVLASNNLYSWLAGVVSVWLAFKGFEILGKRISKKGFFITMALSVIMIFLGNHIAWVWTAYDAGVLIKYSTSESLLLWKFLTDKGYVISYLIDLILGYLCTLILGYRIIKKTYRNSIGGYTLKKCE